MSEVHSSEWKREVHRYIDEQIEAHNTANQKEFRHIRDGQLKIEADIEAQNAANQREFHQIRDGQLKIEADIEAHNTANQKEFRQIRDGQLKVEADIDGLESRLTAKIEQVLAASATAHKEILERLERLENK